MTWLYSVLFTGLMMAAPDVPTPVPAVAAVPPVASVPAVAAVPAVAPVPGDETERFEKTYPLNANGRVCVSNVNGSIVVEAWDRSEVKLEYTKTADTREHLADVEVRIEAQPDSFTVEADYDNLRGRDSWKRGAKLSIEFRLMVPRGAVLNEVETVNGSVTVSNFVNVTRVSAVNGSVKAANLRGSAKLSTVNGDVEVDFDRLESSSKISLETVNGRVNLVIPSDASATVKADSLNGNISNDFGLPVRKGKYVGRDLYGRIGSGDVHIRLNSVNGALSISRRNDGKSLSPSTDLLPQKGNDDWDDDNDRDASIEMDKMNKDIEKSIKAATKSTKDLKVKIADIAPAVERATAESLARTADAVKETAEYLNSEDFKGKLKEVQQRQDAEFARVDAVLLSSLPRVEKKSNSFAVKGVPNIIVNAKGCAVRVRGWDKSEVRYEVTKFAGRRSAPLRISDRQTSSDVTLEIEHAGSLLDANTVRVDVYVPRKSDLKINADGEIRLEGVSGKVELIGSDESVNVRDVNGTLRVASSEGRIRVIGFKGDLDAQSGDGMISLEGDFAKLTARSNAAPVVLTLPDATSADLDATCPAIQGEGLPVARISTDDEHSIYKIGGGGRPYLIRTGGEIRVRSASSLR